MSQITLFPSVAALIAVVASLYLGAKSERVNKNVWVVPAFFAFVFLLLSLQAMLTEGPTGFWTEHVRNLWGNQIWYDLLLATVAALAFSLPQAKALGMRVVPWIIFTLVTGSIGLYSFIARLLYLRAKNNL
ncbi:MAG: hypothetical protein U0074_08980 [Kouleothrix sp.]|jgi:hypothetical protein